LTWKTVSTKLAAEEKEKSAVIDADEMARTLELGSHLYDRTFAQCRWLDLSTMFRIPAILDTIYTTLDASFSFPPDETPHGVKATVT
jgi:hypothetical protein